MCDSIISEWKLKTEINDGFICVPQLQNHFHVKNNNKPAKAFATSIDLHVSNLVLSTLNTSLSIRFLDKVTRYIPLKYDILFGPHPQSNTYISRVLVYTFEINNCKRRLIFKILKNNLLLQ